MFTVESIHPKHSASSTTSGYGHLGLSVVARHEHNQTPGVVRWFASSHARHCERVSAW